MGGERQTHQSSRRNSEEQNVKGERNMTAWFWYAVGAAVLYGAHQIFTKLAADRISDGLGGFVVEATAALTILLYLAWLRFGGTWNQTSSGPGVFWSVLTGICVVRARFSSSCSFRKAGRSQLCR